MNERLGAEEPGHAQGCGLRSILTAEDVVKTDCFRVRLAMPGANGAIVDQTKSMIKITPRAQEWAASVGAECTPADRYPGDAPSANPTPDRPSGFAKNASEIGDLSILP